MTDAELFNRHLDLVLAMAAKHAPNPTEYARQCGEWLRSKAPRGQGRASGWGGETVYLRADKCALDARHALVIKLRSEGWAYGAIAQRVHLSESRVAHICAEHGVTMCATATCRSR